MEREETSFRDMMCLLCANVFERPLSITTCQHSFCEKCIKQYLQLKKNETSSLRCPFCQKSFKLQDVKNNQAIYLRAPKMPCSRCNSSIKAEDYRNHVRTCYQLSEPQKQNLLVSSAPRQQETISGRVK